MTDLAVARVVSEPTVGELVRLWRERRGLSQLALAVHADVSTRHLSFVETGRSMPSREMILRLAEKLDLPPRERNTMLLTAGYAPTFPETDIDAPEMAPMRATLRQIVDGHLPYPALVVNRDYTLVEANDGFEVFTEGTDPGLLTPPVNALRLALHPDGMAKRILNLEEWRTQLMARLRHKVMLTASPSLVELRDELAGYGGSLEQDHPQGNGPDLAVPLRIRYGDDVLSFFCTVAVFGMPLDVTVAELAIEAFFPVGQETRDVLTRRFG